jgi:Golgi nucleoside diphosphatase
VRDYTDFKVEESGPLGPCGGSVRIISGEEEGLFGWIAVNYLMDGFSSGGKERQTYGFLDMGGASTQIAFEPKDKSQDLIPIRLRLLNGKDITHNVFTTTWLGYGTNQARQRYVGRLINHFEEHRDQGLDIVPDPCLPQDLKRTETPVHTGSASDHAKKAHTLVGSGNFTKCLEETAPLLNKDLPCTGIPCLFGGKRVPAIDFSVSRFIGVSEYWYSSEQIFGLGGAYNFVEYGRAASNFCMQKWESIVSHHDRLKEEGHLGGDGELEREGNIVGLGFWGPEVELSRLQLQCFKAAWIVNVLHEGLGMPRIVDPGGNSTDHKAIEHVDENAEGKGLGKPTFQSADAVGDTAITWTLGKMVLEASKEIRSASGIDLLIPDPLQPDSVESNLSGSLDYGISRHLPSPLRGHLYGISMTFLMVYAAISVFIGLFILRSRKRLRIVFRRFVRRKNLRTERDDLIEMQDDGPVNSYSSPIPPFSLASVVHSFASMLRSLHSQQAALFNEETTRGRASSRQAESSRGSSPGGGVARSDYNGQVAPVGANALYNSLSSLSQKQNSSSSLNLYQRSTTSLLSRSGAQTPARQPVG